MTFARHSWPRAAGVSPPVLRRRPYANRPQYNEESGTEKTRHRRADGARFADLSDH